MANPVTWFEIIGKDSAALQKFYGDVFAWKLSPPMPDMGNYSMLDHEGQGIQGGIGGEASDEPRVSVYIQVDDPQAYMDKLVAAGGTMLMPPTQIMPDTMIAMFKDPAGNTMGLLKG
jgi:hypothetical protein